MRVKYGFVLIVAVIIAQIFSCANQAPPTGGPEDKTPPELADAHPQPGAVNVEPGATVAFFFSERISAVPASAVTVYPRLPRGFNVKTVRNRLEIAPKTPLDTNTTYLVVVGTSLKDLRGNALSQRVTLMFSTGAAVDESIMEELRRADAERDAAAKGNAAELDGTDGEDGANTSELDGDDGEDEANTSELDVDDGEDGANTSELDGDDEVDGASMSDEEKEADEANAPD